MTSFQTALLAQLYTLVIVDMQPGFSASNDARTITAVMDEISCAIANGASIVVIESDRKKYGSTHAELLNLLADYDPDRWSIETKFWRHNDQYSPHSGALQVDEACDVFGFPTGRFRVCGVNTDICVFFTAMELGKRYAQSKLEIVMRACNVPDVGFSVDAGKSFRYYAGVHGFSNYELVDFE